MDYQTTALIEDADSIDECYYCYGKTNEATGDLIKPCDCTGYLHQRCIKRAIENSKTKEKICPICKHKYRYCAVDTEPNKFEEIIEELSCMKLSVIFTLVFIVILFVHYFTRSWNVFYVYPVYFALLILVLVVKCRSYYRESEESIDEDYEILSKLQDEILFEY